MSELKQPQISPGFKETLDQLYELSGEKRPNILSRMFAPAIGPWQVMNEYDGATIVIANVDGETFSDGTSTFSYDFICDTLPDDGDGSRSREIAKANARLIAAAPDLLEAARELNNALNDGLCNSGTPGFDSGRLGRAQDAIAAAIAKAEGRS